MTTLVGGMKVRNNLNQGRNPMEIKVIVGEDGEEYVNAKDMGMALQKLVFRMPVPSISVMNFVRRFIIEYITARRA
jgi:hypothetical protein